MSHRVKWLTVDGLKKLPIETLSERMTASQYGAAKPSGFSLKNVSKNLIEGEYIERFEYTETVDNPLGGSPFTYKQLRFKRTKFSITNSALPIEIENPASSISELLNLFAEYLGFNVSIAAPDFDVASWADEMIRKLDDGFVDRMRMSHIQISDMANASAVVTGIEDVREHAARFTKKKYRVDLMRIATADGRFELSRLGGVFSELPIPDKIRKIAKESLIKCKT